MSNKETKARDLPEFKKSGVYVLMNSILWGDTASGLTLRRSLHSEDSDAFYVQAKDVNEAAVPAIRRALKFNILEHFSSLKSYEKEVQKRIDAQKKNAVVEARKRLIWSEPERQDVKDNKTIPNAHGLTNHSMRYTGNKKIHELLQRPSGSCVDRILKYYSTLETTDKRYEFLKEAIYIESKGYNPSAAPRERVVTTLMDLMKRNGSRVSMSPVIEEKEPVDENEKPLRIAL